MMAKSPSACEYLGGGDAAKANLVVEYGMPIVLESNQNHAVAAETEVCPTLPAAMGLGGAMCR